MNYIRIIIFSLVACIAFWQVSEQFTSAFFSDDVVKIDGLLNIWAANASLLLGLYITIYSINEQFELSFRIGDINRVLILFCFLVAPLLAIGTYHLSLMNVINYVECKKERELSSRYSSRTYAVSQEVCESLDKLP